MNPRTLRRLLGGYAVFLFFLCVGLRSWFGLSRPSEPVVIESSWQNGKRIGRIVLRGADASRTTLLPNVAQEEIVGEAPLSMVPWLFTLGLVPGRDGVKAMIDGKEAYARCV